MVKGLSPAAGVSIASTWPRPLPGRHGRQDRRDHRAEKADRGLLAVEQVADGLAERAVDLAERRRLPAVPGDKIALSSSMVLRSRSVCDAPDDGSTIGRCALSFSISITSRSSSAMMSVGADRSRTRDRGDRRAQFALDRRDRCRIGDARWGQAVHLLELHQRRDGQRSADAVLGQRRVGAERVERLLHPQRVAYGHGDRHRHRHRHHGHVGRDDRLARDTRHQLLHLLEQVVGLREKLRLMATDRSPVTGCATVLAQADRRGLDRQAGHLFHLLLERGALAAADSLQILGLGRHAFGEDRLVAAAAGSAVLVAQRLDEGRDRARIPAHLEQAGLGGLRCQPIAVGLAVVALAVSAGRFAQPQAEHQHEQMPQRLDPAAIVAQAERRELGGVVGERVAIRVACCRLGHLQRRRVALGELALHGRKHHGHALDVSQRG